MAKSKKGFLDGYKTYDTSEGFGNEFEWKKNFNRRMSSDEMANILKNQRMTPAQILEITGIYTFEHVKAQFRKLIMLNHPDKGGSAEQARLIISAYESLKKSFGIL